MKGVQVRSSSIRITFSYQGRQYFENVLVDGQPVLPTPPNIKYATRLAKEVRDRIRMGTFDFADYFPESPRAQAAVEAVEAEAETETHFHPWIERWFKLLELKPSTMKQYKQQKDKFWKVHLPNKPLKDFMYADIVEALQKGTWKSGKSRNNQLSIIRNVFEMARKNRLIEHNPCDEIAQAPVQKKGPDPFSMEETQAILASIKANYDPQLWNYEQFKFFTGLRTSEAIGLEWGDVDFASGYVQVRKALVYQDLSDTTKTSKTRKVLLNSMAREALLRQKAFTFLEGGAVFHDPFYNQPWMYHRITDSGHWATTLKRCGIRYRKPYSTRHTYAAMGLMSGSKPAFMAQQLGHSTRMFFDVYSAWISSDDDAQELHKIEDAFNNLSSEVCQQKSEIMPKVCQTPAPRKLKSIAQT